MMKLVNDLKIGYFCLNLFSSQTISSEKLQTFTNCNQKMECRILRNFFPAIFSRNTGGVAEVRFTFPSSRRCVPTGHEPPHTLHRHPHLTHRLAAGVDSWCHCSASKRRIRKWGSSCEQSNTAFTSHESRALK